MNGPKTLAAEVGRLRTSMGACFPGVRAVFRGHDLHHELRDLDWLELYAFGITGRRFTAPQVRLLHAMWVYTSYPDARIWNNRVAALAGSVRSTPGLGVAAALAVSEAVAYGGHPFVRAIDFLQQAHIKMAQGQDLAEIARQELALRRVYGFGRPITSADERLRWLLARAEELGLDQGPHLRLAFELEPILVAHRKELQMNYAGMVAAMAADLGFSPGEFQHFMFAAFLAGMPPCYLEAAQRPEGTLFPVPCRDIEYQGRSQRRWPRSAG